MVQFNTTVHTNCAESILKDLWGVIGDLDLPIALEVR